MKISYYFKSPVSNRTLECIAMDDFVQAVAEHYGEENVDQFIQKRFNDTLNELGSDQGLNVIVLQLAMPEGTTIH